MCVCGGGCNAGALNHCTTHTHAGALNECIPAGAYLMLGSTCDTEEQILGFDLIESRPLQTPHKVLPVLPPVCLSLCPCCSCVYGSSCVYSSRACMSPPMCSCIRAINASLDLFIHMFLGERLRGSSCFIHVPVYRMRVPVDLSVYRSAYASHDASARK